ncbi:hypothetical protein [Agromyces sp. GXQ0307]|uniref:hypothetical protein n=1 Tax=Agromyces sp. GXQ0307 TaxID=3377835 RepID=UPI00383BC4CE
MTEYPAMATWRPGVHVPHQRVDEALDLLQRFDYDRAAGIITAAEWPARAEELAAELAAVLRHTTRAPRP